MSGRRIGLAVTTIGRDDALRELLRSAAQGRRRPSIVVFANQSGRRLELGDDHPFPVHVVASAGGASRGRNDACRGLGQVDYVGFPNDDTRMAADTLEDVLRAFEDFEHPDAIAVSMWESGAPRFALPADGVLLDRRTVWRALEATIFCSARAVADGRPFDPCLGTGCATPWQSGEGTDFLLRIMDRGGHVVSARSARVIGPGERRELSRSQYMRKVRAYQRGTGYVFRRHRYNLVQKTRLVLAPWARWAISGERSRFGLRLAAVSSIGRLEGLLGRCSGPLDAVVR